MRLLLLGVFGLVECFDQGTTSRPTPSRATLPDAQDIFAAALYEFPDTPDRCTQTPQVEKKCWTDPNSGVTFRYGCLPNDFRVYSDSCGTNNEACDETRCEDRWVWRGEKAGMCYNSGQDLYLYNCGSRSLPSRKSCLQLHWPLATGAHSSVCEASKLDDKAKCAPASNWSAASILCSNAGARLCTVKELAGDDGKAGGCKAECDPVWADGSCVDKTGALGHQVAAGSKCQRKPDLCAADNKKLAVRCCADAVPGEMDILPAGYFRATSRDYHLSSQCSSSAIIEYSCMTDQKTGRSKRMACKADDPYVYFQFCGSNSTCSSESCTGPWTKGDDKAGVCYEAPQGYLYQYTCAAGRS